MRILCFIDELGSGGAQRQLVTLAIELQRRGHEVRFLLYYPGGHFLPELEQAKIPVICIPKAGRLRRVLMIRRYLRQCWQDAVLAFLEAPSLYAELAGLPSHRWGLIVGERSAHPDTGKGRRRWLRWPHRFADAVVTNSYTNRRMMESAWPCLKPKLHTIYNALDMRRFRPLPASPGVSASSPLRIVVVASLQRLKNMMGLAQALHLIQQTGGRRVVVDWYGAIGPDSRPLQEANAYIEAHGLNSILRFHGPIRQVEIAYAQADVVGLFSHYEGLPNAVCEGMGCAKPIVLSDVCDARYLVESGRNGFLCDPRQPASIAEAVQRMALLSPDERLRMGMESRKRAEQLFDAGACLDKYERLLESILGLAPILRGHSEPPQRTGSIIGAGERLVRG